MVKLLCVYVSNPLNKSTNNVTKTKKYSVYVLLYSIEAVNVGDTCIPNSITALKSDEKNFVGYKIVANITSDHHTLHSYRENSISSKLVSFSELCNL